MEYLKKDFSPFWFNKHMLKLMKVGYFFILSYS